MLKRVKIFRRMAKTMIGISGAVIVTCGYYWVGELSHTKAAPEEKQDYSKLAEEENTYMGYMLMENEETLAVVEEPKEPEVPMEPEKKSDAAPKKASAVDRKLLKSYDYLCENFYQIDSTTSISKKELNAKKFLKMDMSLDTSTQGPQILIYHTHSQEGYSDSKEGDMKTSVMAVGDCLTELLEEKGFKVLHHTGKYDVGDRNHAYSNALPEIEKVLKENPSIQLAIDLHRDGVAEGTHLVTELNGKKTAKIMFFNGLSRTNATGDIEYLKNPYRENNLALSFQLQLAAAEYYPGLTRKIYLKGYRYNMHLCPKSLLVEVGAQTNSLQEAKNAMVPLADLLSKVLK